MELKAPSVGRARSEPSGGGNSTYRGPEAAMSLVFEQGVRGWQEMRSER